MVLNGKKDIWQPLFWCTWGCLLLLVAKKGKELHSIKMMSELERTMSNETFTSCLGLDHTLFERGGVQFLLDTLLSRLSGGKINLSFPEKRTTIVGTLSCKKLGSATP
jgi:hypothetical protein